MSNLQKYRHLIEYAQKQGLLRPLWFLPLSDPKTVKRDWQKLKQCLVQGIREQHIQDYTLADIEQFIWDLQKLYVLKGWEGLAPILFDHQRNEKPKRRKRLTPPQQLENFFTLKRVN